MDKDSETFVVYISALKELPKSIGMTIHFLQIAQVISNKPA